MFDDSASVEHGEEANAQRPQLGDGSELEGATGNVLEGTVATAAQPRLH